MNPTLDTDAIRKRFSEAIIGIREDGTMAVLVLGAAEVWYFDIVKGLFYEGDIAVKANFPTLIRPGDRCEGEDPTCKVKGVYRGITFDWYRPFLIERDDELTFPYPCIRPLPAPAAKPNPDLELAWALIENAEHELDKARAALERASK